MKKKILALVMALTLLLTLALPAFAAPLDPSTGDVKVAIDADSDGIPDDVDPSVDPDAYIYQTVVDWESLDFMYSGTWNSEEAHYEGNWTTKDASGNWVADNAQNIKVQNRSNAPVNVSASLDTTEKFGASAALSANASGVTLASAADAAALTANGGELPDVTFTVTVSGNPTVSEGFKIGTVTVTFSK